MNIKHDREAVLKTGLALFCNKGYSDLGVDEICRVTGMTKGAFYNAYKSKEQFLNETIALYSDQNVARIVSELDPQKEKSPLKRLQNFYIKMLEAQPRVNFTGCYINNMMAELGVTNAAIGGVSKQAFDRFLEAIEPTVAAAQVQGELINTLDARQLTTLLHTTFYGVLTIARSSKDANQGIKTMDILFQNIKSNKNG